MAFFRRKPKETEPKILNFGLAVQTRDLDPRRVQDNTTALVLRQVYETPMIPDKDNGEALPLLLAEAPTGKILADGREIWTARVRDDIVFSDGTPLTSKIMAKALTDNDIGGQGATVEAQGDRVLITLERPNPLFPNTLAAPYSGISLEAPTGLLGTGPFRLAKSTDRSVIRLVKNPNYRDPIALDGIHFVYMEPDDQGRPTSLLEAVKQGKIHITNGLPRDDVADLKGVVKSFQPGNSTALLHFNCRRLEDPRLRRALALAIDRSALARLSYENALAFCASGPLPPMFGSMPDGIRESLSAAKSELEASTQELPPKITLLEVWAPRQYIPHPQRVSQGIAQQLSQLGVEVEIQTTASFDDFYDRCRTYDYDLALAGWISDTPHAADFLESNLGSSCIPEVGKAPGVRFNLSGFTNSDVDRALLELRSGSSQALDEIAKQLEEATPFLALLYGPSVVVHQHSVKGYQHQSVDSYRLWEMDLLSD